MKPPKGAPEPGRLLQALRQLSSSPADLLVQGARSILGDTLRVEDLIETILDRAIQDCNARNGFVLLDADSGRFRILAARAPSGELREPWKLLSNTIVEGVIATRQPVFSREAARDPVLSAIPSVHVLAIYAVICFPLLWFGRALGAIYLDSGAGHFGERERALVEELADRTATILGILLSIQNYQKVIDDLQQEVQWLQLRSQPSDSQSTIVGQSERIAAVKLKAAQVARSELTVLLVGETGTGKDLFARWIHDLSPRRGSAFVAVNCAAIQDSLAESELFGHAKGAYTGATSARAGRVEQAEGGTLFLDEIGDMSPTVQAKLLRLLENKECFRVGDDRPRRADIRVIAATNRDLEALVAQGRFRQDLYYRLDQYRLALPALRERPEDIGPLVDHILRESSAGASPAVSKEALELLRRHRWPGNVRELSHLLRRCLLELLPGAHLDAERIRAHLPAGALSAARASEAVVEAPGQETLPWREASRRFERDYLESELRRHPEESRAELAQRLGLPVRTLHYKLRDLGLLGQ